MSNIASNVEKSLENTIGLAIDELGSVGKIAGNTVKNTVEDVSSFAKNTFGDISNFTEETLDKVGSTLNIKELLKSPILYGAIAIFLTMYGPRLQPKLPEPVRNLFNNNYFRFVVILLISYIASRNLQLALIVSIAFCLLTSYATSQEVQEKFIDQYREGYSNFDTIRENFTPQTMPTNLPSQTLENVNTPTPVQHSVEGFIGITEGETAGETTGETAEETEGEAEEAEHVCGEKGDNLLSTKCISYCYSQAGFDNEYCKKLFPNPQVDCTSNKLKTQQERTNCLDAMCALDSNKDTPYCKASIQGTDEKDSSSTSSETFAPLEHIQNLAKSLGKEVLKYKNPGA